MRHQNELDELEPFSRRERNRGSQQSRCWMVGVGSGRLLAKSRAKTGVPNKPEFGLLGWGSRGISSAWMRGITVVRSGHQNELDELDEHAKKPQVHTLSA